MNTQVPFFLSLSQIVEISVLDVLDSEGLSQLAKTLSHLSTGVSPPV